MKTVMRPTAWMSATMMMLLPAAAVIAAEGAQEPGVKERMGSVQANLPTLIGSLVMFALLFFVLKKLAWTNILKGLQDRETKIRTEIESAENARKQANDALAQYQRELANARSEANAMIQQAKASAEKVAGELRARNETELAAMKNQAREEIENAKKAALNEIYAQAATLSTSVAAKILQREINAGDQARLVEESLTQLKSMGGSRN